MKIFYLGYKNAEDEFLTEFENSIDADYNAEEWVKIEAENLEEAKLKYEESFENWKKLKKATGAYDFVVNLHKIGGAIVYQTPVRGGTHIEYTEPNSTEVKTIFFSKS